MQAGITEPLARFAVGSLAAAIVALVLAVIVLGSVPPVDRDALTHHLAVPKLYLKHGGLVEIPWVPFSYYPMNLDLIYLVPLYFGNDIIPKYIHFAFGLFTAGLIYSYLKRRTKESVSALLGALLFLSLPVVIKLSTAVYVDLGLAFFSTASLLQLIRWASRGLAWRHLISAGAFCGLALGTKYNGLITFFLLACFVPVIYVRGIGDETSPETAEGTAHGSRETSRGFPGLKAIGFGAVFAVVALMVFSPWMIRNYSWTRNPVYPLYDNIFNARDREGNGRGADADTYRSETNEPALNHFAVRRLVFHESLLETLSIPVRIFFQGEDDNPKYFDGRLNPYLFFFPMLAFTGLRQLPRRLRNETLLLASFSGLYLLFAFVQTDMRIRYVAPMIPPLSILAALGAHNLILWVKRRTSSAAAGVGVIGCIVGLFMLPNVQYAWDQFHKLAPLEYVSGRISRDDYIQRFRPEYATYQYINAHLPQEARVLGVFLGDRRYYCDRELICDGTFESGALMADSADALARMLRAKGFSHIMIRTDLFEQTVLGGQPADAINFFKVFFNRYTHQLFSRDGYVLLALSYG
jgi:4-amino-4-deoxy-L-arabinose transferase-like glycosyltransferase